MSKKQPERARAHKNVYDIEAQQKHLRRHLESLERDNHQPLDDVEGLVSVALAHIEDDNSGRKRQKISRANPFSTRQNLGALIIEARLDLLPPDIPTYLTCNATPSQYPPRQFCSVCSFQSSYRCSKCGMKYCSVKCLRTHEETRCMKWTI
ncbi:hypothetical protein K450DRAFT_277640 [Umbelopsis ramanniana AG]|uniref:HIT-type domain-containing protein n=1 Tax=Umbelopsis ramanniana AG TaxID=1314678 RepID=A0AAD5EGX2_UMBRA|nr:uncharacterized protein K450DRAFT_277640 [Umbelopsis ramanniana AG]KAI8583152.1 hypothetical protein K450DRAFT_277640 [Umbelopsis ramanniana AG]